MTTLYHYQFYQKRVARAYDYKVKPKPSLTGDLVLMKILLFREDSRGKFMPNFKGPYVLIKVLLGGALHL